MQEVLQEKFVWNIFVFPEIPNHTTPEAVKQPQKREKILENIYPTMKETQPKDYVGLSRKCLALTCPPGKHHSKRAMDPENELKLTWWTQRICR